MSNHKQLLKRGSNVSDSPSHSHRRKLDIATLRACAHEHGDSIYIVNLQTFKVNYQAFLYAFRAYYPNTNIAYSYKTNYTPRICELVRDWGGYAEIVSGMEYALARRLNVKPRLIVYNGPYKPRRDVEQALTLGSIVNIDWPYQADIVEEAARRYSDTPMTVGIRVTFPHPSSPPSRFGFEADGEELAVVLRRLRAIPNVEVAGFHCHFLTAQRSAADYRLIADRMLRLTKAYFRDTPPRFLNLGGGYFSPMTDSLKLQFHTSVPTFVDYADAIAPQVAAQYPGNDGPELLLEPGMALVANVVKFATPIVDVRVLGGRRVALAAGSIYDIKPTLHARNLPLEIVRSDEVGRRSIDGPLDIVGSSCMEHDILFTGFPERVALGDYAMFDNVGAYTTVLRPPFIRECPAILGWNSETGAFEVLKRKETFADVFTPYTL